MKNIRLNALMIIVFLLSGFMPLIGQDLADIAFLITGIAKKTDIKFE